MVCLNYNFITHILQGGTCVEYHIGYTSVSHHSVV